MFVRVTKTVPVNDPDRVNGTLTVTRDPNSECCENHVDARLSIKKVNVVPDGVQLVMLPQLTLTAGVVSNLKLTWLRLFMLEKPVMAATKPFAMGSV